MKFSQLKANVGSGENMKPQMVTQRGQWNIDGSDSGPVLYQRLTWHCVLLLALLEASDLSQKDML